MRILLAVGTGSFLGGMFRYLLSQFIHQRIATTFPTGTLLVNIFGCLLIGFVFGFSERSFISQEMRLFLATGLLGGFTTFSAFSNETVQMLRDGQFWFAATYVGMSVIFGILATFTGIIIAKLF